MIVKPDFDRDRRCGIPEVVYGESKTTEDIEKIIKDFVEKCGRVMVTKLDEKTYSSVKKSLSRRLQVEYNRRGRVLVVKKKDFKVEKIGSVGLLTAGTSDIPVAEEARVVAEELGCDVVYEYDVGVAGIHRLYPALDDMKEAQVLIVVAGMEGALPSVVSGLVGVPVIGVPTSVGYGVGAGGRAALHTMLNSCTPVAVVNIDNGYGAAILAYKIIKLTGR